MSNCGGLLAGIDKNCDRPITSGTGADLLLISKTDWDEAVALGKITFDATTGNLITDCVLNTGKLGYLFESNEEQIKPKITEVIKNGAHMYKQELDFVASKLDASSEKVLDDMRDTAVVAIYTNLFKGTAGETKYKVLGVDSGLKVAKREIDPTAEWAGWTIGLASRDTALESKGQYTLYKTDEATTDAVYAALQVAAV